MKPILTIKRQSRVSPRQLANLRKAGYVVLVVRYHDDVRAVHPALDDSVILELAVKAMRENYAGAGEKFDRMLATHVLAQRPAKAKPTPQSPPSALKRVS